MRDLSINASTAKCLLSQLEAENKIGKPLKSKKMGKLIISKHPIVEPIWSNIYINIFLSIGRRVNKPTLNSGDEGDVQVKEGDNTSPMRTTRTSSSVASTAHDMQTQPPTNNPPTERRDPPVTLTRRRTEAPLKLSIRDDHIATSLKKRLARFEFESSQSQEEGTKRKISTVERPIAQKKMRKEE